MNTIMTNLSIVVFSKDRPLQLQGYLESLVYFSKIHPSCITVLYTHNSAISYETIIERFAEVTWKKEESFFNDLSTIIGHSREHIMFGCDDVVFKVPFDIHFALDLLSLKESIFGFSLRLGKNIKPLPEKLQQFESHLEWNWHDTKADNWNYPWELDATIYRKSDVVTIVSKLKPEIVRNPNYFEAEVATRSHEYIFRKGLAAFNNNKCIVLTVNRVQDDFLNSFDNTFTTDTGALYKLYEDGCRIDFLAISRKNNNKIHVGVEFLKLAGDNLPYNPLQMYFTVVLKRLMLLSKRVVRKITS